MSFAHRLFLPGQLENGMAPLDELTNEGPMGAIKNFGHFWPAKDVNWNTNEYLKKGHARRKGDLRGYSGRGKNKQIIDFRSQIGVYALFSQNREVICVGQAGVHEKRTIFGRLRRDRRDHLRGSGATSRGSDFVSRPRNQNSETLRDCNFGRAKRRPG